MVSLSDVLSVAHTGHERFECVRSRVEGRVSRGTRPLAGVLGVSPVNLSFPILGEGQGLESIRQPCS